MSDHDDTLDGCAVVFEATDYVDDDALPYVILFAGVPEWDVEPVAAAWRLIFAGDLTRAEAIEVGRRWRELTDG